MCDRGADDDSVVADDGAGRRPGFEDQKLAAGDRITVVISAEKDGKLRLLANSWDSEKVILPGEQFNVRWIGGQVHLIRRTPKSP
jgi:hypothetical protein